VRFFLLLAAAVVLVRDPTGKWAGDPLQPWFQSLQNKKGLYCCAEADGHPLDESEWDIKNDSYRVFLKDKWIVVPDEAVISSPNKLGKAIVWLWPYDVLRWGGGGDNPIRCFIPGSGV
jgi:hypothetical protein